MFDCPNTKCGKKAERLVASSAGLGCNHCQPKQASAFNPMLHQVVYTKGIRVTLADKMRIKTNRKNRDGEYRPDPRWRTSGD